MEPPSLKSTPASGKKPARRVRKNSKPDTSDGFLNSNFDQNSFNNNVTLSTPSQPPNHQQQFYQPPQNNAFQPQNPPSQPNFAPQQPNFQPQNNNHNSFQPNANQPSPNLNMPFGAPSGMMANMAMAYGSNLQNQGQEMMNKYLDANSLKLYFQVDSAYVRNKLKLLFLPFLHKDWNTRNVGGNPAPLSPKDDVNVPDLYLPTMGMMTYVLLAGILVGRTGSFNPEVLGSNLSYGISWIVFEVMIVRFIMYLLNITTDMKIYDVASYCGYKFIPVCTLMVSLLVMPGLYWVLYALLSATIGLFIYNTLKIKIIQAVNPAVAANDYGEGTGLQAQNFTKKSYISIGIAAVQPILMYVLTYSFGA